MERRDWTLLVVCAAGGEPVSPAQLQKVLFLLGERQRPHVGSNYYSFIPYHYGPFDQLVYVDAQRLEGQGLIAIEPAPGQRWDQYRATPAGLAVAERVRELAPRAAVISMDELVNWGRSRSFEELVSAVYEEYPAMREKSIFRGRPMHAAPDPSNRPFGALHHTPEGDAEQDQRSHAEFIRERTLQDPDMLEVLEEARRRREEKGGEWITFDDLDERYPSG